MMSSRWLVISLACLMAGCASTPDVVYRYYPSKAQATVTVSQAIDCTTDKSALVIVNTPALNTVYSADYSRPPFTLHIKALASATADADLAFSFFDDGRLKSVNASTTGQGEAIVKSAVSLVTAAAALGGSAARSDGPARQPLPECTTISNWGNNKPVTLNYSAVVEFGDAATAPVLIPATPQSMALWSLLKGQLPQLAVFVRSRLPNSSGPTYAGTSPNPSVVFLALQNTENVIVDVLSQGATIYRGNLTVPLPTTYDLPIPKPALFGKQSFSLTLSDSGAVTAVDYGTLTGTSGALNALGSGVSSVTPESTATKAAEVKAQADLIAQEQRLVRCEAKPDACT